MEVPSDGNEKAEGRRISHLPLKHAILLDQRLADARDDLEDIDALLLWQQATWESEQTPFSAAQEHRLGQARMAAQTALCAVQEIQTLFSEERVWITSGAQEVLHAETPYTEPST